VTREYRVKNDYIFGNWRTFKILNAKINVKRRQMLLKMAVNAAICSTFEVQYGKSTRTTALNVIVFHPVLTCHVIWRMRSGRVRIFYGNQWETL